jgi:hypothetical protein
MSVGRKRHGTHKQFSWRNTSTWIRGALGVICEHFWDVPPCDLVVYRLFMGMNPLLSPESEGKAIK